MKRLLLAIALLGMNAEAQQALPPPKIIAAPQGEQPATEPEQPAAQQDMLVYQQQPAQQEQPAPQAQSPLPPPKPIAQANGQFNKGQLFIIVPLEKGIHVLVDPTGHRHPCFINSDKNIICRW